MSPRPEERPVDHDAPNLVIVSNRLPVDIDRTQEGLQVQESPGGLASALHRLLSERDGAWLGWPGLPGRIDLGEARDMPDLPYELVPIHISEEEHEDYYRGFANEILWPLFHDLHPYCEFEPRFWDAYGTVNRRFAENAAQAGNGSDPVWIHDYHLFLTGQHLRSLGDERPLGFFLHIPFPSPDTLQRLPWHGEILEALTAFDLIGVQTRRDLDNLEAAFSDLLPDARAHGSGDQITVERGEEDTTARAFPISTDTAKIAHQASQASVERRAREIQSNLNGPNHTYIVGVERLDYTKGIPERLEAFRVALDRYPSLVENVTLIQHVNPSREEIEHYQQLRKDVELAVGRTNGAFGTLDWNPVRYSYGHLAFSEILALYRLGDVALITPLRDGMNLVAKEYCAANEEEEGVLVLSKFAGAAEEIGDGALLVNPHDVDETADAIHQACSMPARQRNTRMRALRSRLESNDVHAWSKGFLDHLDPRKVPIGVSPSPSRGRLSAAPREGNP